MIKVIVVGRMPVFRSIAEWLSEDPQMNVRSLKLETELILSLDGDLIIYPFYSQKWKSKIQRQLQQQDEILNKMIFVRLENDPTAELELKAAGVQSGQIVPIAEPKASALTGSARKLLDFSIDAVLASQPPHPRGDPPKRPSQSEELPRWIRMLDKLVSWVPSLMKLIPLAAPPP